MSSNTGWSDLGEPGAEHDGRPHVSRTTLLDDLLDPRSRHGHDGQIDPLGNGADRGETVESVNVGGVGIDRVGAAGEPARPQGSKDFVPDAAP